MKVSDPVAKFQLFLKKAWTCSFGLIMFLWAVPYVPAQASDAEQVRAEILYGDGMVVLLSDFQQKLGTRYSARGSVLITYQDMILTGDEAEYDEKTQVGFVAGHVRFSQKEQWLTCSKAEFNFAAQTGAFYDASGYTDRQFSITARTILKTGRDTYRAEDATITACREKRPKWNFSSSRADIRLDHTARLHSTVFKVKGIPVFYAPYLIVPMEKKTRSSGFLPFRTGTSTSKGRMISEGYYQTLGRSADLRIYGDYFTLRGLAVGGIFRATPNPTTHLNIEAYGIKDKLDQGGVLLSVDGESLLKDDWRAVARVNISSSFSFRQAFADNIRSATVSQEHAIAFLNRNHDSFSTNIAFQRDEVVFPVHSLVTKKLPSLEFLSLGTPLGKSPFVLSFRTSLDGMSRTDGTTKTPKIVQRLDVYPTLTVRLPAVKGFSFLPSVSVRETYYGAQLSDESPTGTINKGLNRQYADLNIDVRMPVLEKDFSSGWTGRFRHTIEPFLTYRLIGGIENPAETIRFDEQDAIADTNEIEYGIVNRFFKERRTGGGTQKRYQFMSLGLIQKYYFDPTFGGAFKEGQSNSFYPLDTVTGLYQTGILRNLSPISAILQLTPQSRINYDFRADFDTKLKRWRNESLSAIWQQGKFMFAGTFFKAQSLEQEPQDILTGNTVQGSVGYGSAARGFSTSLALTYNIQTARLLNSITRMTYTWDCCGLSAEMNQYSLGFRTESKFSFSFSLKGIGSFGNLRQPAYLF